jgi:uncharacterized protein DUF1553/uncharacterized protein DUF1549/cytochrome c
MYARRLLSGICFFAAAMARGASFDQVESILHASCVKCHQGEKALGGLRLDAPEGIARAVVPGKSADSLIIQRITTTDLRKRMPLGGPPLPPEQIALVRAWIEAGAAIPKDQAAGQPSRTTHWAYKKPVKPAPPEVKHVSLVRNPIDRFLLARLEKEGLSFSPEASKETLIRRLSLDLTGLPPSPGEIDAFLADTRPDAYERLVDRLLASPHFGERWARPWLDMARYADSNGYERDEPRTMWVYRGWVIDALNKDMPFDEFTIEQIAGDMLPDATRSQKIATGFHRNTQFNEEGGVDKDEAYFEVLVDRVNTTATVWLGSTLACTQCHNHKYDPFTQKDYYSLMAFFSNGTKRIKHYDDTSTKYLEPEIDIPSPDQEKRRNELITRIQGLERQLDTQTPELDKEQQAWERSIREAAGEWQILVPARLASAGGAKLTRDSSGVILVSGENAQRETFTVEGKLPLHSLTGLRIEALPDPSLPRGGPGRDIYGNFVISSVEVETAPANSPTEWQSIDFKRAHVDDGRRRRGGRVLWMIDASREDKRLPRQIVLEPKHAVHLDGDSLVRVTIVQNSEFNGQSLGHFRISATDSSDPALIVKVTAKLRPILETDPSRRTPEQAQELSAYFRQMAPSLAAARDQLQKLQAEIASLDIPTALVMNEEPGVERPYDFIHIRGAFANKGEKVYADVPAALPPLPEGWPHNRLGLARWLVSRDNPLTARVTVNRIWEQYFGHGIVETSEDFGTQGERPVHPELLDWLATEFMDRGWSMKAIHRLIVTSTAYRQTSRVTPQLLQLDPYNRLIARGPRFRMEAEMIRDSGLAASGLLTLRVGGPSVFPRQPPGIWDAPNSEDKWVESQGEDRYRRSIYTFLRRSAPYPVLMNFDAPSREICTVRRTRTNTPLQALTTLNDQSFFEMAQALAMRMLREGGATDQSRLDYGFRLVTGHYPKSGDAAAVLNWLGQKREYLAAHLDDARKIAGDSPDPANHAAWTMLANVLLNLDEAVTKE